MTFLVITLKNLNKMLSWEAQKLTGTTLKVVWAEFSTLSPAIFLHNSTSA
jgi:hypothetical protein